MVNAWDFLAEQASMGEQRMELHKNL